MRNGTHRITLVQLLERHWMQLLHETSISELAFAACVRECHEASVVESARTVEWSTHPDLARRMVRDAEKLRRWFCQDVAARFPTEIVEPFVQAFPDGRGERLWCEILARHDYLPVRVPKAGGEVENLGRVGRETGEAIIAISCMLDDFKLDHNDRNKAPAALLEIEQAMGALAEMHAAVKRIL